MTPRKRYLSADDFLQDQWRLAALVRRGGWRPDWILGLWRGGAPVAIAMHEFLRASGWDVRHVPLKCASYDGIGRNDGDVVFTLGDEVFAMFRRGERVLVVDDVFDTGKTAAAMRARLGAVGVDMRLACVYFKPAKNTTDLRPDYFVGETDDGWLVFPHELEGLSPEEVSEKSPALAALLEDVRRQAR